MEGEPVCLHDSSMTPCIAANHLSATKSIASEIYVPTIAPAELGT